MTPRYEINEGPVSASEWMRTHHTVTEVLHRGEWQRMDLELPSHGVRVRVEGGEDVSRGELERRAVEAMLSALGRGDLEVLR